MISVKTKSVIDVLYLQLSKCFQYLYYVTELVTAVSVPIVYWLKKSFAQLCSSSFHSLKLQFTHSNVFLYRNVYIEQSYFSSRLLTLIA